MKIEARHVKRKQLTQYLDKNFLKQERKNYQHYSETVAAEGSGIGMGVCAKRKSGSLGGQAKRHRVSESVSLSGQKTKKKI